MFTIDTSGKTDYWRGKESQSREAEERALSYDETVPFEERAAVHFSAETAESLIRHYCPRKGKGIWFGNLSDAIAWDLRRLFGDESGFELFDACRFWREEDEGDEDAQRDWPSFNRERKPSDVLLIDLMDEASHFGWEAPPDLKAELGHLREIADKGRAERDALREAFKKGQFPLPNNHQPAEPVSFGISAADLQKKDFAPVNYIVPGIIAEGATILAGKPKVGKSWMTLDMGIAVASDAYMLGKKVITGDALVLALEDNQRRLKDRCKKLIGPFAEFPGRLTLATEWPRADQGGIEKIEAWIKSVSNPRLIVVDVLQKFRAVQGGSQNAYAVDYQAVSELQKLASKYRVAIVICHHLRKGAADNDAFDKISGTMGLSGAADAALVLDRDGSGEFTLAGRGRDIEEVDLAVRLNRSNCRWNVLGEASEIRKSDARKAVLEILKETGRPMKRTEIAAGLEKTANAVDQLLWKMIRNGDVIKSERGLYSVALSHPHKDDKKVRNGHPIISPPPY